MEFVATHGDFHIIQGYQEVNLPEDLYLKHVQSPLHFTDAEEMMVLIGTCTGFGQVAQHIIDLFRTETQLKQRGREHLETQKNEAFQDEMNSCTIE